MKLTAVALTILVATSAHAEWKPQYADASQATQDWYASAQVTDAAFPRLGFRGCCVSSEVVRTKFKVSKIGGKDEWSYLDPVSQTWKIVPSDIVHWGESAPDGRPTLFVLSDHWADVFHLPHGTPSCFYPAAGGL